MASLTIHSRAPGTGSRITDRSVHDRSLLPEMKKHLILVVLAFAILSSTADAGLKIFYIRHAEGGHNVKSDWEKKGIPEADWPAYVGNPDMFTPKGLKEVEAATEKLKRYQFDFIATSPMWRVRHTIIPYLKETGQKAEVWPELSIPT